MKISRHLKSVTSYLFEHCSKDIGSMIIWTTIAGWIASSTAQILGIYQNSKYTNEQKKFMINQELADAGMNILSYFAITMPTKAFAKKLVTTGKILPRSVRAVIRQAKDGKKIGNVDFDISKQTYFSKIEKPFNSFSNFMGTSAAVLGGTISSNIVTPILRNRFASKRQSMPSRFDTREDTTKTTISPLKTNSGFNNFRKTSLSI